MYENAGGGGQTYHRPLRGPPVAARVRVVMHHAHRSRSQRVHHSRLCNSRQPRVVGHVITTIPSVGLATLSHRNHAATTCQQAQQANGDVALAATSPQTVTGTPAPGAQPKIFCAQVRSGARSNTIRWPASAPTRRRALHAVPLRGRGRADQRRPRRLCRSLHDGSHRQKVRIADRTQIVIPQRHNSFCLSGRGDELDFKPVRLIDLNHRSNVSASESKLLMISCEHDRI